MPDKGGNMVFGVILAGGIGSRMGNVEKPKQYLSVGGKPIILHTLEKFYVNSKFEKLIVLCPSQWINHTKNLVKKNFNDSSKIVVIEGGSTRNETIMNSIRYIEKEYGLDDDTIIVTHDSVRPFLTYRIIEDNIRYAQEYGACDTVIPASDTIVESAGHEIISNIPDRSIMYQGQTPQSFKAKKLKELYEGLTEEEKDTMLKKADTYNEKLKDVNRPFLNYAEAGDYNSILDISGTGIMGYVTIEKLGVELPIYHGTSEGVLQVAAGHLEGSSLPVGGEGTHSVLSAHRGLPSARLFTNLDKMEAGDTFTVTVLDRKLTYQVDQIKIVEPQEINDLTIEEGKDYCTLMTCTPYGINSHRLLVRGERISQEESGNFVTADGYLVNTSAVAIVVAIILLFWILLGLLIWQRFSWKRKKE